MRSSNTRTKANPSYSSSHLSKAKTKETPQVGKMTKFRSLDDIPDSFPDSVNYGGSTNDDEDEDEDVGSHFQQDRPAHNNLYGIHNQTANVSCSSNRSAVNEDDSGIRHAVSSLALSQPKSQVPYSSNGNGKAPPLPYDQFNPKPIKPPPPTNQVPALPNSKYFDYDNSADDFENDEIPYCSPKNKYNAVNGSKLSFGAKDADFAPPLPCECSSKAAAEDSIYFSKKPRPVNFKPYTLKQYKLTTPKEYVEISNIKPDLNSDDLVAKRANLDRIKEFSKNLQSFNRQAISQQAKLPPAAEKHDIVLSEQKFNSRRQKAIEFAKNVPLPKSKVSPRGGAQHKGDYDESELSDHFNAHGQGGTGMDMGADYAKESRIMELEAQHNNRKLQIEVMKKSLGLK